jgi:hypothetical protein
MRVAGKWKLQSMTLGGVLGIITNYAIIIIVVIVIAVNDDIK